MKLILFTSLILINFNIVFSQNSEIERLIKIKDEFIIKRTEINDSIKKLDVRINYLESKEKNLNIRNISFTETKTRSKAKIKNKPDVFGDIIGYIPEGKIIKVYDYFDSYWLIEKDSIKGYTSEMYLVNNQQMNKIKKNHDKDEIKKIYGESVANKIFNHSIWIGMTADIARLSIGSPLEINRTTGSWGIHEQWVYKNRYLYFENDKLTSWQD
ncbi:MAG: hypothetical protein IMY72_09335 [Bacteroidetes bacterium]|nr:hypothetical protein [Bacteroidota bacterium]